MREFVVVLFLALAACKQEPAPYMAPEPNPSVDPNAFYAYLLEAMPQTLEKATCACCNKSLAGCYRDMFDPQAKHRCPPG